MEDRYDPCALCNDILQGVITVKIKEHIDASVALHKSLSCSFDIADQLIVVDGCNIFGFTMGNSYGVQRQLGYDVSSHLYRQSITTTARTDRGDAMDQVRKVPSVARTLSKIFSGKSGKQIGKCQCVGRKKIQKRPSNQCHPVTIWLFVVALLLLNIPPSAKAQQREQFLSAPNTWSVGVESLAEAYQSCLGNENSYNKSLYTVTADCTFGTDTGNGNLLGYRFALYFNEYGPGATKTWWYDFFPYTYSCSDASRPAGTSCVNYKPPKNLGCGCTNSVNSSMLGDPINAATGNAYVDQEDFVQGDLSLHRYYNSDPYAWGSRLGIGWLHTFDRNLRFAWSGTDANGNPSPPAQVTVQRQDGLQLVFNKVNGAWQGDADVSDVLTEVDDSNGYVLSWTLFVSSTRQYETYSPIGALLSISDGTHVLLALAYTDGTQQSTGGSVLPKGLLWKVTDAHSRALTFSYSDNPPNVASVTEPDGGVLKYGYDSSGRLASVTYPDGTQRQYRYDQSAYSAAGGYANKLTSVIDESNTAYTIFGYQSDGRANSTQESGGANLHKVSYAGDGSTSTITYPLGQQATATFTAPQGTIVISNMSARCGAQCDQQYQSQTLDTNGYPAVATDFNGNVIKTTYDANGLLDQRIEATGTTSQRTTNFTWNTTLRLPLTRTTLDANGNTVNNTQWLYNTTGQTLARCDIDPTNPATTGYTCTNTGPAPAGVRRWTYTYCTAIDTTQCPLVGLLLTSTGPRTDTTQTTTYSYYLASSAANCGTPGAACYQAGDLHTITDAAGHVTSIASYDANGRATRITDANGVNTDLTYTPRGWLASRSVNGQTTTFTYTPYGAVQTVTDADNITTTYGYDAAHRLVNITDALGNTVQYTLDAAGNKTA
ncbi:MAG TPA: DUF6531 domain-containing protein, partial [Candidatus Saccharimonadales bacterium]|nr:DUF6531 domain-containing protein [Candidatus Saccharimonadales bacterium]